MLPVAVPMTTTYKTSVDCDSMESTWDRSTPAGPSSGLWSLVLGNFLNLSNPRA